MHFIDQNINTRNHVLSKVMKRAASCKHRQAVKTMQFEKLTYIILKLGKCVQKYATTTH